MKEGMDDMPQSAYNSKRSLITGGAGFIGSHLAEALLKSGSQVTIIDDLSTGCFENIAHLVDHPNFRFAIDSITNEMVMDRLASECDTIFHLAAAVGVKLIVDQPVHTIKTNIMGTESVLNAALRYHAKVLLASSSEVYGKGNHVPFKEDDDVVLGPTCRSRWAYAASKMVDEFLALAYYREFELPVVIFRLFNTVGPRQTGQYGMVIPRFIQQALAGKPLTVYGDGLQSRCFLHVADAVQAILELAGNDHALGQVFNVGSVEEISIQNLAQKVLALAADPAQPPPVDSTYFDSRIEHIPYEEAYTVGFEDMHRRVPDTAKIKTLTGWQATHNLTDMLADVLAFYRHQDNPPSVP
jgi:UDP-glucose 4-epimerase